MSKRLDLKGKIFSHLIPIKYLGNNKHKQSIWLCQCDCGNKINVVGSNLIIGNTNSCGCHRIDTAKKLFKKHGLANQVLYSNWKDMKRRCYDKKDKNYKNYGGRGIIVCDEWVDNPKTFIDWANTNGYKQGLTIDRNDNNGNYSPENCTFKTRAEQNRNKRTNIKHSGECAIDASRRLGGSSTLVRNRIKRGWSLKMSFNTPLKNKLLDNK